MNAIEHLESQHSDIEDLFHELGLAKDVETKSQILAELGASLVSHAASERRLHAALLARHGDEGLVTAWQTQEDAHAIVAALLVLDPADASFEAKTERLQDLFEASVEHEETELFPRLRGLVERDPLASRGRRESTWSPMTTAALRAA
jgi:hypothetical protein